VLARSGLIVALFVSLFAKSASAESAPGSDRVHVKYWDKWTGSEKDAMQAVVDDFNASQSRIFVDFLSVSLVPRKTLTATAGGNPPDLAGLWANEVADFADKEALTPLDDFARGTIVRRERFLPVYWEMCVYEGRLFALPTTPAVIALLWNKEHFRAAGLDPERPPRTIAELDAYAEKLTKVDGARIAQVGFLPSQPVWWPHFWPYFFHGALWDGKSQITLDTPENVRAFAWAQGYAKRFGVTALENLSSSFGDLASAQDPFMSGKLSMIIQGVWMGNYISQFAPHLDWGAAPFPSVSASDLAHPAEPGRSHGARRRLRAPDLRPDLRAVVGCAARGRGFLSVRVLVERLSRPAALFDRSGHVYTFARLAVLPKPAQRNAVALSDGGLVSDGVAHPRAVLFHAAHVPRGSRFAEERRRLTGARSYLRRFLSLLARACMTAGGAYRETSPPWMAISRTSEAETKP
jgi:maltose-binding protein MalE